MSLRVASYLATSALRITSSAAAVVSSNVANADTDGYTRKTANLGTQDTAVGYSAVDIKSVSSSVDALLLKSVISSQSDLGKATTLDDYLNRLQEALGTTDSDSGIDDMINDVSDAFASLATSPDSDSAKANAVQSLETLTSTLHSTSSSIQSLRSDADSAISSTVDDINEKLKQIDALNDSISAAKGLGQDTGDQEDERAQILKELAEDIDIRYQTDDNGAVRVWTSSGSALVDDTVHTLSHTAAASVTADTVYSATGTSGFDAITLNGTDITSSIHSGTLKALVDLRDTTLPAQQTRLDNLATTLKTTLNDIHNEGTATPAPNSLTGTTSVSATDALSASGTLRVAVVDSDGNAIAINDIDLSTLSTVQDVVDAINTTSGVSASITSDGKLQITATDSSYGVALAGTDDSVGSSGKGVSAYFGLNDLLTGTGADDIEVSSSITANSSLLASSALSTSSSATVGSAVLTVSEGSVANALSDAFTTKTSFSAAGGLSERSVTFAKYAGDFIQGAATLADTASTDLEDQQTYVDTLESQFSSQSGVNLDEETAALSTIQSAYEAAAAVFQVLQEMFDTAVQTVS